MNRRKFVLAAGATGAAALAGCVEDDGEDELSPPEEMDRPSTEPLVYMSEAFNYLNGHRDDPPEPDFEVSQLKEPYDGYVESLQYLVATK